MANVALEDVRQIVEDLFMGYISNIRIPNTKVSGVFSKLQRNGDLFQTNE